jgi:hypothetical protein
MKVMRKYQIKKQLVFTDEDGKQVTEQRARDIEQLVACFQHHRPMGENSPISPKAALNMASVALAFFDARVTTVNHVCDELGDGGEYYCKHSIRYTVCQSCDED